VPAKWKPRFIVPQWAHKWKKAEGKAKVLLMHAAAEGSQADCRSVPNNNFTTRGHVAMVGCKT